MLPSAGVYAAERGSKEDLRSCERDDQPFSRKRVDVAPAGVEHGLGEDKGLAPPGDDRHRLHGREREVIGLRNVLWVGVVWQWVYV